MSAMYSMCGDCGSDVPGFHTRGCSKWTPPVSETVACGVCLGKPLASGRECICGGVGTEQAEMHGLRVALFEAEEELARLRAARSPAPERPIFPNENTDDVAMNPPSAAPSVEARDAELAEIESFNNLVRAGGGGYLSDIIAKQSEHIALLLAHIRSHQS